MVCSSDWARYADPAQSLPTCAELRLPDHAAREQSVFGAWRRHRMDFLRTGGRCIACVSHYGVRFRAAGPKELHHDDCRTRQNGMCADPSRACATKGISDQAAGLQNTTSSGFVVNSALDTVSHLTRERGWISTAGNGRALRSACRSTLPNTSLIRTVAVHTCLIKNPTPE